MNDLFSAQSSHYKAYRPGYPQSLIDHVISFVPEKNTAWDCATGNGQAAVLLAPHFQKLVATDISAAQLAEAAPHPNILYLQCPAEKTNFPAGSFDLITVAQAYHWFDQSAFHEEVMRVAKNKAVIAVWMYDRFETGNRALNDLMDHFYYSITGPYWDSRRKYIDDHYDMLPFPYEALPAPEFYFETAWTREGIMGYLSSWSAVQQYIKVHAASPLALIRKEMEALLDEQHIQQLRFPIYLKLGRIKQ